MDHYEAFAGAWLGSHQPPGNHRTFQGGFRRALMFIDNAGVLCRSPAVSAAALSMMAAAGCPPAASERQAM